MGINSSASVEEGSHSEKPPKSSPTEYRFVSGRRMGAGRLVVVNYPPIQFSDFEVSHIPRESWKSHSLDETQ